jgi:endonuclease/exonuclease/phosphatase family metal-dependent hydrolase
VIDQGWFFFSDTPDVAYSRTFNGSFPAFASWAVFHDRTTEQGFRVVNIHTDYASRSNRVQSAQLVASRITPWIDADETLFVVGDLNARLGEKTADIIADAGIDFAPVQGATYHLNRGINLFGAIDHIGAIGAAKIAGDPVVIRRKYAGEWPTDHYPVIADYMLGP